MFITDFEMAQQPDLKDKLKAWAANLNLAAKSSGEAFTVSGPQMLPVRNRSANGRVGAPSITQRNFMGGEKFRLASVVLNSDSIRRGREVLAIMVPADLLLASEITTMSLPLERALTVFDGLEAWTQASGIETEVAKAARVAEANATAALPTPEELRAAPAWGGW